MTRQQKKLRFTKWLRELFHGRPSNAERGRILVEPLEPRQLLAGDLFSALLGSNHDVLLGGSVESPTDIQTSQPGSGVLIGEGEPANDLVAFAQALTDSGTLFYGAAWCPFCTEQKELFEDGGKYLPFVEVTDANRDPNQIAIDEGITQFPTWEFPDGTRLTGVQSLQTLSQRAGVAIPQSESPSFDELADTTVRIGSPLHIPVDAYDPNGGPLTITVSSSNTSVLDAEVLQNNRSLRLNVAGYGDLVFELFENRAPVPSGRVIELAEDGFYDGVTFHRVINNFVIQGGDPTGTGAGGSSLGDFDDQFHVDLQHNRTGVLSFAKSTDDTNDSQFFITEGPQRFLDFNHSVFGQLVEGEENREAISNTATNASDRPLNTVTIEDATVFNDNENGVIVLRGKQAGTSTVTVTVTDADGNSSSQSFLATVAADTANGTPFLNPVDPVQTDINTPVNITLTSQDKENDTRIYSVQALGNQNFGLTVDSASGVVTVTPPTDFVGELQFRATVRQQQPSTTSSKDDNQVITVLVTGIEAPTGIDLLASSDSGVSNSDNNTNATSLTFVVSGTTSGATVEIRSGGQVVGSATATGSSTEVTVSNVTALGQGSVSFTATQSLGGDTSEELAALSVILDRTAPSQIAAGVVPTSVVVGDAVSVDLTVPGEGQGLVYALTAAPAGMTINASTGEIAWTPTTGQLGTQSVGISITDIAGNTTAQDFSIQVTEEPWVELGINVVDANGQPLSTVGVGDTFVVQVTVQDLRGFQATGLFGAYMDLLYNESVIQLTSEPIGRPEPYTNGPKGETTTAGLVDELGAFSSSNSPLGAGLRVLAELEFTAIAVGDAGLMLNPADDAGNDVLLYGINEAISVNRVRYGTSSFAVGLDFELNDDVFNFDEDSSQQSLNVLDNDVISGSSNLTIVGVTTPASGAQVAISSDGKSILYTPAANFAGADVLEYTVQNQNSIQGVATVTIQLADVNDPPQALNDSFTVTENSSNNVLDVLANDNSGDDDPNSETLRILNVVAGSIAGTVSVRADQTLSYTPPADFTGSETFSYTLSDGRGGTSVATVTVNVDVANPPPVAQDDSFSLTEDDGQASFDVLANDSTDDATETLSVSAVGTSSNGSVVQVAADGQSILYTPAANFNGTEVITYTLRDSGGATATANATFTVAAVNDAPTAVDDSASAISRNTTTSLDVLANDQDVDGDDLEIIAVTQPAAGNGSVAIAADGKSLIYTPPAVDFEGMVSLTYTVSDGNGESDTASVQIDVRDFIPRDISGDIYYATFDLSSSLLSNLNVTLEGTDFTGNALSRQAAVQGGRFQFSDVAPGEYTLIREPLPFLNDSGERIAISASMEDGDLEQALRVTGSLRPQFFGIRDFVGSTFGHNLLVALNGDGTPAWTLGKGAWTELNSIDVQVDENEVLKIAAVNASSQNVSASLPLNDNATRAYRVGEQTPYRLLRLRGTPEDVGVEPPASSSASTGEGEGQLSSNQPSSSSASLIGEGEAAPLPTPVPSGLAGSGQVNELPRPSIQAVRSTSLGQGGEAQSQSSRLSLRRSTLASGNSLTLSEAAVDEAMKSVLPKLEIGLSAGLESDLTGDNQSEQEAHDQALQSV